MSKRVIAINGSKRKKNTYGLLLQLKEQFHEKDIELDIVQLHDYNIKECAGCEACIMTDRCPLTDETKSLMEKLTTYDGIIISTPVYMNGVSGKLKTFVDRTCKWAHRPELYGKPILFVVTTAGSGIGVTSKYMKNIAHQWGAFPTDTIGRKVTTIHNKIQPKEYKKFMASLHTPIEKYRTSWNQIMIFSVYKALALKLLERDRNYWEDKGWHKKVYYVDSRIGPVKKLFGTLFFKMLYSKMKK